MTKNVSNLRFGALREKTAGSIGVYGAGKGVLARLDTPLISTDGALLLVVQNKTISAKFATAKYVRKQHDTLNDSALGGTEIYDEVASEESEITMLLQDDTWFKLAAFISDGTTTPQVSIGSPCSFTLHYEDGTKKVDLIGCYLTEYTVNVEMDKPITQTIKFKHRKAIESAAMAAFPAISTTAIMRRTNLIHAIFGTTDVAALEMIKASLSIKFEWNESKVLNDDFLYEATIKKVTWKMTADYLTPNDGTQSNMWESKMNLNVPITNLAANFTVGTIIAREMTNMALVECVASDYGEKGNIKYSVGLESTSASAITVHAP